MKAKRQSNETATLKRQLADAQNALAAQNSWHEQVARKAIQRFAEDEKTINDLDERRKELSELAHRAIQAGDKLDAIATNRGKRARKAGIAMITRRGELLAEIARIEANLETLGFVKTGEVFTADV